MDFGNWEDMRDFYEDLYKMCNLFTLTDSKKPDCFKTTGFSILFHIWYHNKDRMGRAQLVRIFKSKITNTPMHYLKFVEISRRPGVGASRKGHGELIEILNSGVRKEDNKFAAQ